MYVAQITGETMPHHNLICVYVSALYNGPKPLSTDLCSVNDWATDVQDMYILIHIQINTFRVPR